MTVLPRSVGDSHILVGACLGQAAASQVLQACLRGRIKPVVGAALLAQGEEVLARQDLFIPCRLWMSERDELLDLFIASCGWGQVYFGWHPNLPDEAGNRLIDEMATACLLNLMPRSARRKSGV